MSAKLVSPLAARSLRVATLQPRR